MGGDRWALDFVESRGGEAENGDVYAAAGQIRQILTNPDFNPDAYLSEMARRGRGLSRAEADALAIRRKKGQAMHPWGGYGAGWSDPGPQFAEGSSVEVRRPGELYHGERMPDEVIQVPVSRAGRFGGGR